MPDDISFFKNLASEKIRGLVIRLREYELIINNPGLSCQYNKKELEIFKRKIDENVNDINLIKRVVNKLDPKSYPEVIEQPSENHQIMKEYHIIDSEEEEQEDKEKKEDE